MKSCLLVLVVICGAGLCSANQNLVDYLASSLQIQYNVVDCYTTSVGFTSQIIFTNSGNQDVNEKTWEIYFNNIRMIESTSIRPSGTALGQSGLMVYHVNGVLFRIAPGPSFSGFARGESVEAVFLSDAWMVSKTDIMPNWYVVAPGAEPKTITSTAGESLDFVGPFTSEKQWKRRADDSYNPYTPEERLEKQHAKDLGSAPLPVLPTPVYVDLPGPGQVNIESTWKVVKGAGLDWEAHYLAGKLTLDIVEPDSQPAKLFILLQMGQVLLNEEILNETSAYSLSIETTQESITITGIDKAGVFYGVQSLLSLYAGDRNIPAGDIVDYPRFPYRGMHVDIARNFHSKADLLVILEAMAMYKMNKFYLHATDDEAWRLEIPGLPELTTVGASRCHDPAGDECLMPQLGSGPTMAAPGSGFLSIQDYKDILTYANDRHIQVIPEFDFPGHAHAAVNAMMARYRKYKDTNMTAAEEYLLTEEGDPSDYLSVQYFTDNAVNPCLDSTYNFMRHLVQEVINLHKDIQPLEIFNFGGDEVPYGAWANSTACQSLKDTGTLVSDSLKEHFAYRVAEIAHDQGLDVAAWEDGLMEGFRPFNRSLIPSDKAIGFLWDNVWEWGRGQRSYVLANADFQVVLSHATHLYFDHPYEPDPAERGFYWATRIVPTYKTFSFMPDSIYDNMLVDGNGNDIDRDQICEKYGCEELMEEYRDNIIGMQGQLWSETVRTREQLHYMIFPRILALAERAWHRAEWEELSDVTERQAEMDKDWEAFANTLGYKELSRLDDMGIDYRLPPPGGKVESSGELTASPGYPGLQILYSMDGGSTWSDYDSRVVLSANTNVTLETRSVDGFRGSRRVSLTGPVMNSGSVPQTLGLTSLVLMLAMVLLYQ